MTVPHSTALLVRLVALAAALLAAGCTSFTFTDQALLLRHLPDEDALEVLVVYGGVHASEETRPPEEAGRAVAALAGGARHVVLLGWPWEVDLDALAAEAAERDDGAAAGLARDALRWAEGVEVVEAGLWRQDGRLHAWQRLRVAEAAEGARLLDLGAQALVRDALGPPERDAAEAADPDARTRGLWRAKLAAGSPWVVLDAGAVELRVPLSPAEAAERLRRLVAAADGSGRARAVLAPLASVRVEGGEWRLRLAPDDDGWLRVRLPFEERRYDPSLSDGLAGPGGGSVPDAAPSPELAELVRRR